MRFPKMVLALAMLLCPATTAISQTILLDPADLPPLKVKPDRLIFPYNSDAKAYPVLSRVIRAQSERLQKEKKFGGWRKRAEKEATQVSAPMDGQNPED
ncbi:MAG TPA: hypothetical protein V6C72_13275 [Chroococcales cyanobacterium]